jgi:uncharacterized membrane protein YoaK (UPF0700 family)
LIRRLPKWVEFGAFILAFVAGYINVIGLLGFEHQSVSHLSGTATLLGARITEGRFDVAFHLLGVLLSFFIGAFIAGALLHGTALKLGRHYQTVLIIEALLLFLAYASLSNDVSIGHFFASAACGLQNAFATSFSGAIVRTTHVTGIFTDLGLMFGSLLRGERLDRRKAKLFLLIIVGFVVGGVVGAYVFLLAGFHALLIPIGTCLFLSLLYQIYLRHHHYS